MPDANVMRVSHLRECLGFAVQQVAASGEPIIVQRYSRQDVILVPLWEWQFLKQVDADIQAGKCPWENRDDDAAE